MLSCIGVFGPEPGADVGEGEGIEGRDDPPAEGIGTLIGGAAQSGHFETVLPHVGPLVGVGRGNEGREATGVRGRVGRGRQRLVPLVSADEAVGLIEPGRENDACGHGELDVGAVHLLVRSRSVGVRGGHAQHARVGGRVDDLIRFLALVHVAGRSHDEGPAAHGVNGCLQLRVPLGSRLCDDDDLRALVGGPLNTAAHLRHEGLFAFLVRAIVLKPGVNAHWEDLRLGGDADEARSHVLGQLLRGDRTSDGGAVFADVDAPIGVFTAQVDAGEHHGAVRSLEVLVASSYA